MISFSYDGDGHYRCDECANRTQREVPDGCAHPRKARCQECTVCVAEAEDLFAATAMLTLSPPLRQANGPLLTACLQNHARAACPSDPRTCGQAGEHGCALCPKEGSEA